MYNISKYNYENKHKLFFSSDWHVFHNPIHWDVPIWKQRGYDSVDHAAECILNTVNSRVGEDDTLFYLGDMFMNATDIQCLDWLSKLKCKNINYLFGNHESNMFRLYKDTLKSMKVFNVEVYPARMGNINFMGNHLEIQVGKKRIVLNHFPIHSFNGMYRNSWMVSGHSHNTDKTRNPDYPINKVLDVSWDWKKDVWSYDEIDEIMSTKTFVPVDHHNKETT